MFRVAVASSPCSFATSRAHKPVSPLLDGCIHMLCILGNRKSMFLSQGSTRMAPTSDACGCHGMWLACQIMRSLCERDLMFPPWRWQVMLWAKERWDATSFRRFQGFTFSTRCFAFHKQSFRCMSQHKQPWDAALRQMSRSAEGGSSFVILHLFLPTIRNSFTRWKGKTSRIHPWG